MVKKGMFQGQGKRVVLGKGEKSHLKFPKVGEAMGNSMWGSDGK